VATHTEETSQGGGEADPVHLCDDASVQRLSTVVVSADPIGEFADEIRRIFHQLGREFGAESLAGECAPALDVLENDEALEITIDLPGVDPDAIRVIIKGDAMLVAGEKAARRAHADSTFHLVERGFGRFARIVRLDRACDAGRARATLDRGELRISIPKIVDRRGRPTEVPVQVVGRSA
jgi:HSP20 family protein